WNDQLETGAEGPGASSISDLIDSLDISTSGTAGVSYQVPIRFWDNTNEEEEAPALGWSTVYSDLSKPEVWYTSQPIRALGEHASGSLDDIIGALEGYDSAFPIAAGFQVWDAETDVLVSSFTASGETTYFYPEPGFDTKANQDGKQFVHADDIDPE